MLKDTKMFRSMVGGAYPSRIRDLGLSHSSCRRIGSKIERAVIHFHRFSRVRDIRATCHTLRLTRVHGNRQAPCGRIVSCSGALRASIHYDCTNRSNTRGVAFICLQK